MIEIWKPVVGFENYEVSNLGRARNKKFNRILKGKYDKDGYIEVSFRDGNIRKYTRVHRAVAEAFIKNTENLPIVNHKNGIKDDNRAENLEWCTHSYNTKHGFDVLGRKGQNGGMNKPIAQLNSETLEVIAVYNSIKEATTSLGKHSVAINNCLNGRSRTAFGYKWKFVDKGVSTNENTQ